MSKIGGSGGGSFDALQAQFSKYTRSKEHEESYQKSGGGGGGGLFGGGGGLGGIIGSVAKMALGAMTGGIGTMLMDMVLGPVLDKVMGALGGGQGGGGGGLGGLLGSIFGKGGPQGAGLEMGAGSLLKTIL